MFVKENNLQEGFAYLSDIAAAIVQDVRYAGNDNFMGRPAKGYNKPVIMLTNEAAHQLALIQEKLEGKGLGLKVFDGYRPQSAVDDFWDWAHDAGDLKMKEIYYPTYDNKEQIFTDGFIARLSKHSRGSAVDLTIIDLSTKQELDMGGIFDFFGEISHTMCPIISEEAKANRMLLKSMMEEHGFQGYSKEWWHYELINEPFPRKPEDHFNFPVE